MKQLVVVQVVVEGVVVVVVVNVVAVSDVIIGWLVGISVHLFEQLNK